MISIRRFMKSWSLRKLKVLLAVLLIFGISLKGIAKTEFSEQECNMFRSFYYDSFNIVSELAGKSEVSLSPEEFGKLPEESKRKVCSIVMDFQIFRTVVTDALFDRTFGDAAIRSLTQRIMFDLAEVEWVPLNEVRLEDHEKIIQAKDDLIEFTRDNLNNLTPKFRYCLDNWIIDAGLVLGYRFSSHYTSVPVEFQLREFYRSQLPFVTWVLENTRDSQERVRLRGLVESIKHKYLSDTFLIAVAGSMDTDGEESRQGGSPVRGQGLEREVLSIDSSKLGKDASRAVNRWPAAQKADPGWDWTRVLVFFVQSALIVQGHDPGKLDGLMGPKTMLALLAWSAASGPSWDEDGDSSKAYRWGLDGNVAHLLHGTLEAHGLSPGPEDQFLGPESVKALDRWDGTFRRAGLFMRVSEDISRNIVMDELGAAGPADSGKAVGRSMVGKSTDRSPGSGYSKYECLKISWSEGTPACHSAGYGAADKGECIWALDLDNSCSHGVVVHLLVDLKDGRGPLWHISDYLYYPSKERVDLWRAELPEHVKPYARYCAHKFDPEVRGSDTDWQTHFLDPSHKDDPRRWYRNDYRDAQGNTTHWGKSLANANFAPNATCMDTY